MRLSSQWDRQRLIISSSFRRASNWSLMKLTMTFALKRTDYYRIVNKILPFLLVQLITKSGCLDQAQFDVHIAVSNFYKRQFLKHRKTVKLPHCLDFNSTVFSSLLHGSKSFNLMPNNDSIKVVLPVPVSPTHNKLNWKLKQQLNTRN